VQIDTPGGSMQPQVAGEYRLSVFEDRGAPLLEVAVIRGAAEVFTNEGTTTVATGERVWSREGEVPSHPTAFNSARWDGFDRWSQQRLAARRGVYSAQHLPQPISSYAGVLDTYGYWAHQPAHGYVWFPRVAGGWRPYYHGRWRFYASFGWTWMGADVWAWPTHHYGRWGLTPAGAWFWVPGRQWGPAWVHWAVAPGYVSWCALGFDNRPVYPFWRTGHRSWAYDRWNSWVVVPRQHFGAYRVVSRHALDRAYFASRGAAPAFVVQRHAPDRSFAVAREAVVAAPARGIAVRRGTGVSPGSGVRSSREYTAGGVSVAGTPTRRAPATADEGRFRVAPGSSTTPAGRAAMPGERAGTASAGGAVRVAPPPRAGTRVAVPRDASGPAARGPAENATTSPGTGGDRSQIQAPGRTPARSAVPRSGAPARVWSPDQVPVHRGTPPVTTAPAPSAAAPARPGSLRSGGAGVGSYGRPAPARTAPGTNAREADRGAVRSGAPSAPGATRRVAPRSDGPVDRAAPAQPGPSAAPPPRRVAPSGSYGPPSGESRATSRGSGRGASGPGPSRAAPPPPAPTRQAAPPPSAAAAPASPRQAPAAGGRGTAARRGSGGGR
jgi:hypothetical protein